MNKLFALILLSLSITAFSQEQITLSLEESISKALENNQQLKNAKLDVNYAEAQVDEVLSNGLPQINGNLGFTHNVEIPTTVIPSFTNPSEYIAVQFGIPYSMQGVVGLNQLVFDGTFFLGLKASSEFVKINELIASKSEQDVREGVTKAYYMALISDQNLAQLNKSLENLQTVKHETQRMYEEGFAEKLDVDRIVLSVANLEININKLKEQAHLAKKMLLNSMGLNVNQQVTLTTPLPEFTEEAFDEDYGSSEVSNRIEIQMLEQQQVLNHLNLKRYRIGFVPSLYLNANYGYNTFAQKDQFDQLGKTWYSMASYGLSLNVPLFDGLYKRSKVQQIKINILKTENELDQTQNYIALEVYQTRTAYQNAFKNLELQQKSLNLAKEIHETTRIKFKEGLGSSFELVQSESDLTTAHTNYLNALYELNVAKINLDKALGKL